MLTMPPRDSPKVQFNVYLPTELVTRVKHRAVDEGSSLSTLVSRALTDYLAIEPGATAGKAEPKGS